VDTITVNAVRSNPNAKVANLELNTRINQKIKKRNVFEAILLDDNGFITEGSRSNIFMIKDDLVFTAPLHNVLPGITRSKILEICSQQNYPVKEINLRPEDLVKMEAVFLTGTSPNVLPVKQINSVCFNSAANPLLIKIMKQYDAMIADYIKIYSYMK
jgi:branched-chain amino acid aminotransferase